MVELSQYFEFNRHFEMSFASLFSAFSCLQWSVKKYGSSFIEHICRMISSGNCKRRPAMKRYISYRVGYELGIVHSGKQRREKLKKLKQDYKKLKDHNNRSGSDRRTNKWYERLDALLGHRPAFSGAAVTKDSATALLETTQESEDQWVEDVTSSLNELQATETSVSSPALSSSSRPVSPAETHTPREKEKGL